MQPRRASLHQVQTGAFWPGTIVSMRLVALVAGIISGVIPGFFIIGPALFADGPSALFDSERLMTYALVGGIYFLFGLGAGLIAPTKMRWTITGLALPGIGVGILLAVLERPELTTAVMYVVYLSLLAVFSILGGKAGAVARRPKSAAPG